MKSLLIRLLAAVGALVILAAIGGLVIAAAVRWFERRLPSTTVLEVDLERALPESVPDDPIAQLVQRKALTLRDVVEALERAGRDERVKGLVATLGAAPLGMAEIQELRDAVSAFRKRGKTAIAFSETYGEFGPGVGAYYLATAFDEVWLQPSGDVGLTGMMFESPFLRGTLDKLGVVPRLDHRHEYKSAKNLFTEREYTAAHEEAMQAILDSRYGQLVKGIAEGRGKTPEEVRALIDRGPFLGQEALDAKLVDRLAYRDELTPHLEQKFGEDAKRLSLAKYLARAGRPHDEGPVVALIYGVGGVYRGKSEFDPLDGEPSMGSDTLTAAFRAAVEDEEVKAILFRVSSPGGSYVASDAIWRETVRAREAGKPIVVSMGNVAGSGGYFVAMAADKIVAQPATITGSIGVVGGKLLTTGLWDHMGLAWDEVRAGRNAAMWSSLRDYSPEEWARLQTWLDRVYVDFTAKVAEGRKLPVEKVRDELARGRIWTGEDAKARGLVDALGGYAVALDLARQAAGVEPGDPVKLRVFPKARSPIEQILEDGASPVELVRAAAAVTKTVERLRPVVERLRLLGLAEPPAPLTGPDPEPLY